MVSSTESLRESNSAVSQYITGFTSHFVKLERCVKLLSLQDKHSGRTRTQSERKFLLEFTDSLTTLHEALKDLSRAWSHKRSIEQQLPTSSERLRTTNACLVNALSAVSSSAGKVSSMYHDLLDALG
ncbi:unnamed protein product, partial [Timema podura]|nr:unnamed protein product [Timema podura]